MKCEEVFSQSYRRDPAGVAFCPYRICPMGAHTDHQWGKVTGFAIDKGVHIAYGPKQNGVIELQSLQFPKRAQWHIRATPEQKENDWADYLRGAALMLFRNHPLRVGLCGVIEGSLPIGGLSSSAAVTIAFLAALCRVNGLVIPPRELLLTALQAEREYVGVNVGKLDQSCEIYSKKDHLLYLDTRDDSFELIPTAPDMKPYDIVIFFSGAERNLQGSKYNMRVDELKAAAYALKAFAGMEYGKFKEGRLRDVPREIFEEHKHRLPVPWRLRAEHYYTEFERTERGAEFWRAGDIESFGRLVFESGHSSIHLYDTGSEELKTLHDIMCRTPGIYGGRFSGAGFRGCSMALVDPEHTERVIKEVSDAYLKTFPGLESKYSVHICRSADGVQL